jgi:hypothetical protein
MSVSGYRNDILAQVSARRNQQLVMPGPGKPAESALTRVRPGHDAMNMSDASRFGVRKARGRYRAGGVDGSFVG